MMERLHIALLWLRIWQLSTPVRRVTWGNFVRTTQKGRCEERKSNLCMYANFGIRNKARTHLRHHDVTTPTEEHTHIPQKEANVACSLCSSVKKRKGVARGDSERWWCDCYIEFIDKRQSPVLIKRQRNREAKREEDEKKGVQTIFTLFSSIWPVQWARSAKQLVFFLPKTRKFT